MPACSRVWEEATRLWPLIFEPFEFNPLHPEVSRRIGAIQLARNQPDQALVRLDQAVDLAPDDGEVHLLRGRAHLMFGGTFPRPSAISGSRPGACPNGPMFTTSLPWPSRPRT